ncbi:unnamed protein product [Prunus armeniaca]
MGSTKPYLAVIFIQIIYAGMILLSKAAFNGGMNSYVFVFYRQMAGALFMSPLAMIFERKSATPLSVVTFCKIFMLSFLGITLAINAYCIALTYTSATLGAASVNCLPVATFFFAVLLRMEKVKIKTAAGIAKVAGLVVSMIGVAVLCFYKGPQLKPFLHPHLLESHNSHQDQQQAHASSSGHRWMIGCFLLLVSIICWSLWLVLQGIMVTGVSYYLQAYVIEKKGPVFQAMSQPLNLIITVIGSVLLLGEAISLGSVLGGILLAASLYSVLWGKSKEQKSMENGTCLSVPVQPEKERAQLKEAEATITEPTLFV